MSGTLFIDRDAGPARHRHSYVKPPEQEKSWSALRKLSCLLACGFASWSLVIAPFLIWG
jgi:hypothetical protein